MGGECGVGAAVLTLSSGVAVVGIEFGLKRRLIWGAKT